MKTFSLILSWTWDDEDLYEKLTTQQKCVLNKKAQQYLEGLAEGEGRFSFPIELPLELRPPDPAPHTCWDVAFFGQWSVSTEGYDYYAREERAWMKLQEEQEEFVPIVGAEAVAQYQEQRPKHPPSATQSAR